MATQPQATTPPVGDPADEGEAQPGSTPPADAQTTVVPPVTPAAAPTPPTPPAPAARARGKKGKNQPPAPPPVQAPQDGPGFMKRVYAKIQKELGCTLEEAKKRMSEPTTTAPAAPAAPSPDADKLQRELASMKTKLADAQKQLTVKDSKHRKDLQRWQDRKIEADMRLEAAKAGISDVGYALHLLAEKVSSPGGATGLNPTEFFAGLRTSHPVIFSPAIVPPAAAAPVAPPPAPVVPATTRPTTTVDGSGAPPPPAEPGRVPNEQVATTMSEDQFREHTRRKYGVAF